MEITRASIETGKGQPHCESGVDGEQQPGLVVGG